MKQETIEEQMVDMKVEGLSGKEMVIPIYPCWVEFKGETVVSQLNFDETKRVGRPMFDISYCMTRALNQNIMKTVQYDKNKFKISPLENK